MHEDTIKGIDSALKRSKLKDDVHVYHGTNGVFNPGTEAAKHPEGHIKLPAYTSTSISRGIGVSFAQPDSSRDIEERSSHVIHIHMKKGQHGMYVGSNSKFPREREMILPRNTVLKVHPVPTELENNIKVWHAHIV